MLLISRHRAFYCFFKINIIFAKFYLFVKKNHNVPELGKKTNVSESIHIYMYIVKKKQQKTKNKNPKHQQTTVFEHCTFRE
jgi:hypothetical protein